QLAKREQHAGSFGKRNRAPAGEGLRGRRDRVADHRGQGEIDGAGHLPGRRVVDVTVPLRGTVPQLAADPVTTVLHLLGSSPPARRPVLSCSLLRASGASLACLLISPPPRPPRGARR